MKQELKRQATTSICQTKKGKTTDTNVNYKFKGIL